jgi:hypothetical protein
MTARGCGSEKPRCSDRQDNKSRPSAVLPPQGNSRNIAADEKQKESEDAEQHQIHQDGALSGNATRRRTFKQQIAEQFVILQNVVPEAALRVEGSVVEPHDARLLLAPEVKPFGSRTPCGAGGLQSAGSLAAVGGAGRGTRTP